MTDVTATTQSGMPVHYAAARIFTFIIISAMNHTPLMQTAAGIADSFS
jgi:hypothetical protein